MVLESLCFILVPLEDSNFPFHIQVFYMKPSIIKLKDINYKLYFDEICEKLFTGSPEHHWDGVSFGG